MTVREQILAAMVAQFEGDATHLDGVTIDRMRDAPVRVRPSLVVLDGPHTADQSETGAVLYAMDVTIEGHVEAATDAALGPAINDLYGRVLQSIYTDATWGDLAIDTRERSIDVDVGRRDGGGPVGFFSLELEVQFWTAERDPSTVGPG